MDATLNNRCKICNLIKVDEKLWVQVHNKIIEENLAQSVVCRWLNSMVDVLNASREEPLAKFNTSNFTNHFKSHISSLDKMRSELKNWTLIKPKRETTAFDETQKVLASAVTRSNMDSYSKLSAMIDMMEENLECYSDEIRDKREKQRVAKNKFSASVSAKEIEHYSKFVSDLLNAKQNLLKLKNAEQTTMMAVDAAVEFMAGGMTAQIKLLAAEIKATLESELEGKTSLPDQISKVMKSSFGVSMRDLVHETTDMVKRNYGVK